jgi:hypothetical protein
MRFTGRRVVGDRVRADQIESMEEMVEAIVALADCPAAYARRRTPARAGRLTSLRGVRSG